jgi:hypothetical protein
LIEILDRGAGRGSGEIGRGVEKGLQREAIKEERGRRRNW